MLQSSLVPIWGYGVSDCLDLLLGRPGQSSQVPRWDGKLGAASIGPNSVRLAASVPPVRSWSLVWVPALRAAKCVLLALVRDQLACWCVPRLCIAGRG